MKRWPRSGTAGGVGSRPRALPSVGPFLVGHLVGARSAAILPLTLLALALCFAAGFGAEWLFRRVTADVRRQATDAMPGGSAGVRLGHLLLRLGLDLLGLAVFAFATLGAFFVAYQGHEPVRLTLLTCLGAVVLVSRFLLAPDAPALRIVPLEDDAARELHRRVARLAVLWAALFPTISLLRALGLDPDLGHLLGTLAAATFVATLIALVVRGRHPVAELIRRRGGARPVVGEPAPASWAGWGGVAIGFDAQALVKDIVSGAFFLLDDAFLGEYIEVGEVRGTVEKISTRSLRLRHHRGPLHTVPYGEITRLTNHSRDWAIMKLEFLVPHDTNLATVKKIFKRIGQELKDDPVTGPNLLEPLKSQGVLRVEDSGLVIRAKFMASRASSS